MDVSLVLLAIEIPGLIVRDIFPLGNICVVNCDDDGLNFQNSVGES